MAHRTGAQPNLALTEYSEVRAKRVRVGSWRCAKGLTAKLTGSTKEGSADDGTAA
jgi:hypothetical protein